MIIDNIGIDNSWKNFQEKLRNSSSAVSGAYRPRTGVGAVVKGNFAPEPSCMALNISFTFDNSQAHVSAKTRLEKFTGFPE